MLLSVLKFLGLTFFSKKVRSGCRASARRVAEGRARAFRDQSNAMLALSPKREYKSVALAFSVFPKQRQKKGNICSAGCLPVPAIKTAHRAFVWLKGRCSAPFVLAPALGILHPLSWQKDNATMQGTPMESCRAAFSIPFHRTPLQCCNLHPR